MIKFDGNIIDEKYFPDGTSAFRLEVSEENKHEITWAFDSNAEMITIYFIMKHLKAHCQSPEVILNMPYIPNARMDRVKNSDEVFTLRYFADFINSLGFVKVNVYDPHSDVSPALINNISAVSHLPLIEDVMQRIGFDSERDIVFYPDNGCAKKYESLMQLPYLKGDKKRDWRTGKIQGLEVRGDIPSDSYRVLIIDDICSRGGTFYHSAKKLKELGAGDIYLYITHCENSILDGDLIKSGLIKKIFTTDSIFTKTHENIEIIKNFR